MWKLQLISDRWQHTPQGAVRGYAYTPDGQFLQGADLAEYLTVDSPQEWQRRIAGCNGLFAAIHCGTFCAAAIDSTRISPLYYRCLDGDILLSDDPHTLLRPGDQTAPEALEAYYAMAAPFEGTTLVQDLLQLRPGHILHADGTQTAYYTYATRPEELHMPTFDEFEDALNAVFRRLIDSAGGRQIVIPLSGGNDSRLILSMLHRLGYANVLCYTVGRPDSYDCTIATQVAALLGYPIYQINTTEPWAQALIDPSDPQFLRYTRFVGGLTNFVWLFEYPALIALRKRGRLAPDALFVPGHAADFNAGSHLRKALVTRHNSPAYLASAIAYDGCEYEGYRIQSLAKSYFRDLLRQGYTSYSAYQSFIFRNRLPHNINNSARIYEFFGYDVRLPFWDRDFLETFRRMPYDALRDCTFYVDFVRTRIFLPLRIDFPASTHSALFYLRHKLRHRLKRFLPASFLHARAHLVDTIGEHELLQPLLRDLIHHGVYPDDRHYLSNNQVIRDWYLMQVRLLLEKNTEKKTEEKTSPNSSTE